MKTRLLLCFLLSLFVSASYSQQCGSDIFHKLKIETDSAYKFAVQASEKKTKDARAKYQMAKAIGAYYNMQAAIYTIPVVVHLIHTGGAIGTDYNPSVAQVNSAIDYLNSIYGGSMSGIEGVGDIGIQFVLAARDPAGNPSNGINRVNFSSNSTYLTYGVRLQTSNGIPDASLKATVRWDPGLYYNIYVVNKIDGEDGTSGGPFVAGYAQYPNLNQPGDGTVMLYHQLAPNQKTLPHELGHALGLPHPFASADATGATCPPDSDLANTGDGIADTDPITIPAFVARTGGNPCTNAPARNYNIFTEHNFMNYTDRFTLFTPNQRDAMQASMSFPGRASLHSSWAKQSAYPYAFTSPIPATCTPVTSSTGTSSHYSGVIGLTVGNRVFSSSTTPIDNGYLNKSASPLHLVPLAESAGYSLSTVLYTPGLIANSTGNYHQVSIWVDYNNDGQFLSGERILFADNIPPNNGLTGLTSSFTVPAGAVSNTFLRMRVVSELGSIYGLNIINGCYQPVYGQGEDYPVFISSILPVSWKYFKGQKNGENSWLQWATSGDATNKYFEVERSVDGVSYEKIGTVASSAKSMYSFVDIKASEPIYFYRLKQVDQNNKSIYSSVIILRNEVVAEQGLRVTNPFQNTIDISLQKAFKTIAQVELVDINGRKLAEAQMQPGQLTLKLETGSQLPSGLYLLKIKAGTTVITRKVVK